MPVRGLTKLIEGVHPVRYVGQPKRAARQIQTLERALSDPNADPHEVVRQHGFQYLDSGMRGTVYVHPKTKIVVKLYHDDPAYRHFLDTTWDYDSEHFPRYYGRVDRGEGGGAVFMERLRPNWIDTGGLEKEKDYLRSNRGEYRRDTQPTNIMRRGLFGPSVITDPWAPIPPG